MLTHRPGMTAKQKASQGRTTMTFTRRNLLAAAGAAAASSLLSRSAGAQSFPFSPNQRYPDPAVQILDPSFAKYRIYSSTVEQVATGMRWAEGPAYFPEGGYLHRLLRHPQQPHHEVR
jgi:gluconolactonase